MMSQHFILKQIESIIEELSHDRVAKVFIGLLYQEQIQVFVFIPQHGKLIFIGFLSRHRSNVLIQQSCLTDEVERNISQRDILFEYRAMAAPFAEALAEDEGIVSEVEEVFDFGFREKI